MPPGVELFQVYFLFFKKIFIIFIMEPFHLPFYILLTYHIWINLTITSFTIPSNTTSRRWGCRRCSCRGRCSLWTGGNWSIRAPCAARWVHYFYYPVISLIHSSLLPDLSDNVRFNKILTNVLDHRTYYRTRTVCLLFLSISMQPISSQKVKSERGGPCTI